MMSRLAGSDLSIELPTGWEAEIYRRPVELPPQGAAGTRGETTHTVLHAGNFPLPPNRGDFGSGAVEIMRRHEVLIVLMEYHADSAGTALFRHEGLPLPLVADDFSPDMMQRPLPGQAGTQKFFSLAGRPFCLYVVLGSYRNRRDLVTQANHVLNSLNIDALL